jgi:heme/copper-type cytochrome/quinol oxidase subunit 1
MRQAVVALIVFAAPFAAYALYRIAILKRAKLDDEIWDNAPIFWLSLIGALLVVVSLVLLSVFGQNPENYVVPIYERD